MLVRGFSSWSQNLARLKVGVPIADRIGRKDGAPSSNASWILASPYKTPGLEPDGYKSFLSYSEISPWSSRLFRKRMIRSSIWIKWFKAFLSSIFTLLNLHVFSEILLSLETYSLLLRTFVYKIFIEIKQMLTTWLKVDFTSYLKLPCLNHFLYSMENFMNNVMA